MRSMLSELARTDRLRVTDEITLEAGKTRLLVNQLKSWELDDVLIIVEAVEEKLYSWPRAICTRSRCSRSAS